ncbi:MAG: DUF1015 domain-containing protein [Clostridia bacterium]|nr:DUF1015 domain-containing protein [Clostridia bacterium]
MIFSPADILLPKNVDWTKWSVVACDQYTSEPDYWKKVEETVGDAPSTLRLTLPEVYLASEDAEARIGAIHQSMAAYADLLTLYPNTYIYVERTLPGGRVRRGIVGALDLEAYSYEKGSTPPVRATEGTVLDRIPPRMRVRRAASLELPHVMVLADDREKRIIEPLAENKGEKLYDFTLMGNGGHIAGYKLGEESMAAVNAAIEGLEKEFRLRHPDQEPLLFAVGDGNHSLATAKACYEEIKKTLTPEEAAVHPARYALIELVNLHDTALVFEPIHRVAFGVSPEALLEAFVAFCKKEGNADLAPQTFQYFHENGAGTVTIDTPLSPLAVGTLQRFLDAKDVQVDYIHGADVTEKLGKEHGNIGFLLPAMDKNRLFDTVLADGALPRKTFSMGEANEKRFYLECRRIRNSA